MTARPSPARSADDVAAVRIIEGDALTALRTLESESVQLVCTSPPYYSLRDYGVDGQIGLESTPAAFLEALWPVFDEVRRVLRPDGLCFVNLGDSYAGSGKGPTGHNGIGDQERRQGFTGKNAGFNERWGNSAGTKKQELSQLAEKRGAVEGIPAKNLLLMPERFAIGMQDRGWWVRSRIAWCKTSAMPESVRDRPTSAWEYIWMFSKARTYYYDADAVRQPHQDMAGPPSRFGNTGVLGGNNGTGPKTASRSEGDGRGDFAKAAGGRIYHPDGANLRNFWLLGPSPFTDAHFATFPPEIPKRCILAGSRKGDTVLDPFLGSGTTALVADRLGRRAIGIELNHDYAEMARRRIESDAGSLFSEPVEIVSAEAQAGLWESVV